jgi:hypothetical protein
MQQRRDATAALESMLALLSVDELERLARKYFTRSAIRRRRLGERDAAYHAIAAELGDFPSALAMAAAVEKAARRYAASAWRIYDRGRPEPVGPPLRVALYRALTAGRGDVPGVRHLRRIVAAVHESRRQRTTASGNDAAKIATSEAR